jgi:hypothetical protein
VKKILQRLKKTGLQVDIKKCEFSVQNIHYLNFIVNTDGIFVDLEKISAIKDWQPFTIIKNIQSFLGFCNFYRRFIRNYGRIIKPLNHLIRRDFIFNFDEKCKAFFKELKDRLCTTPILRYYDPELEYILKTDILNGVIAAVLF